MLQTPVLFTVAADLRKMRVIAAVDEADVGEVGVGQAATFTVNAFQDRAFVGVVTEVRNSPVIVQDVVTYGTVVEVENVDLALKPGMTANVRIRTASARDALRAPSAALRFEPPGEATSGAQGLGVWVLDGSALRRVGVTAGVSDGEQTAIEPRVSGSLGVGEAVLTELTPLGRKAYGVGH
jgi:HlyD family secretion protein